MSQTEPSANAVIAADKIESLDVFTSDRWTERRQLTSNSRSVIAHALDAFAAQAVAAHTREPDEAMVEAAGRVIFKAGVFRRWWQAPLAYDDLDYIGRSEFLGTIEEALKAALAAIGPVPQDRDAAQILAAISAVHAAYVRRQHEAGVLMAAGSRPSEEFEPELNSLKEAITILQSLKSSPAKATAPTPPAAERAKPDASDLERAMRVFDENGHDCYMRGNLVKSIAVALAEARREAAADMRERAGRVAAKHREVTAANYHEAIGAEEIGRAIAALPLTEEETISKAEESSQ